MAIDPSQITTEFTLELDEDEIPVGDFTNAFESFFGLIKEVARESLPTRNAGGWLVRVYPGSAGLGLTPRAGAYAADEIAHIRKSLIDGIKRLERGERPPQFSDKAVEHARTLGSLFKSRGKDKPPPKVRLWVENNTLIPIEKVIAVKASELLDAAYEQEGSVDGVLEKLSAHGQFEFVVYDPLDKRAIKCEVQERQLEKAWQAFRKRVEVLGRVRYRKDGLPVSVKAEDIVPFPSPDEIPSVKEMRLLLSRG